MRTLSSLIALSSVVVLGCGTSEGGEGGGAATAQTTGATAQQGQTGPSATTAANASTNATGSGEGSTSSGEACEPATTPCDENTSCCAGTICDTTSLGQVCCGEEGTACNTENGEDCCGNLLCVDGHCGYELSNPPCNSPCFPAPALALEKERLEYIGGSFLGICGDANHTYGYHVPAANLPSSDYSLEGAANDPVCNWHGSAIDIGMDWPASRDWLRWLIKSIRDDELTGIAEVIGSYDGQDVRYWSDESGWQENGIDYQGQGHDTWTHVSIYRSTALEDHKILFGWRADGQSAP